MRRLVPRSLRGQVLLVIVVALSLGQGVSIWLFADERGLAVRAAMAREAFDRTAIVLALVESVPPQREQTILAAATSPLVRFTVDQQPSVDRHARAPARLVRDLAARLGQGRPFRIAARVAGQTVPPMPGMPENMLDMPDMPDMPGMPDHMRSMMHHDMASATVDLRMSVQLNDGRWLNVSTGFSRPALQSSLAGIATFALSLAFIIVAVWLLLGRMTRPLARLASAADQLGRGDWIDDLAPSGPDELARLTTAFNQMQARLRRLVDERSHLLAALGHDLRSPLTALRVRAEMVDDEETRDALIASIDEMHTMVEATLTFARGTATSEPVSEVDLDTFLQTLVTEYEQIGHDVTLAAGAAVPGPVPMRPNAMRRALRNLIDNALRYGGAARITAEMREGEVAVDIEDDGPGIPESDLERVFEPYVRLEVSRSRDTGGSGLGLAIARGIVRAQGGEVRLSNREGGGLRATVTLPVANSPR